MLYEERAFVIYLVKCNKASKNGYCDVSGDLVAQEDGDHEPRDSCKTHHGHFLDEVLAGNAPRRLES